MYNGIGLTTPRGTGTSGHVVKNLSHVKSNSYNQKLSTRYDDNSQSNSNVSKIGNADILDHQRKRAIESKIFELQEAMLDQGYDDEEIEAKVQEKRAELERLLSTNHAITSTKDTTDSHVILATKEVQNERMKRALRLHDSKNEESKSVPTEESDQLRDTTRKESRERRYHRDDSRNKDQRDGRDFNSRDRDTRRRQDGRDSRREYRDRSDSRNRERRRDHRDS